MVLRQYAINKTVTKHRLDAQPRSTNNRIAKDEREEFEKNKSSLKKAPSVLKRFFKIAGSLSAKTMRNGILQTVKV